MPITPDALTRLPAGQAHRVRLRAGDALLVRHGRVWMTREGDPIDHLLTPEAGHVAACAQEVVLESCDRRDSLYERQTFVETATNSRRPFGWILSGWRPTGR